MTSYPRLSAEQRWQYAMDERKWLLFQTRAEILVKASNGASDFGTNSTTAHLRLSYDILEHTEADKNMLSTK